jgi:SAM-dependent methyltransferase/prefoldin subunit 5
MSSAPKHEVTPETLERVAREVARIRERSGAPSMATKTTRLNVPVNRTHNALVVEAEQLRRASSNPDSQVGRMPPEPPTVRGRVGAVLVRLVRRALFWYTQQINEFDGKTAEALFHQSQAIGESERMFAGCMQRVEQLSDAVDDFRRDLEALRSHVGKLERLSETVARITEDRHALQSQEDLAGKIAALAENVEALRSDSVKVDGVLAALDRTASDIENLRTDADRQERAWNDLAERLRKAELYAHNLRAELAVERSRVSLLMQQRRDSAPESSISTANPGAELESLYAQFEDAFRGSRGEIKARAIEYLPLLREKAIGGPHLPVLDLGCGRGEWLEVLAENGLVAAGVESNAAFAEECRARGFVVHHGDAIRFLQQALPESYGAITAFHVIEHLPFSALLTLLDEAARVLKSGGVLMLETPNPANLIVGAHTFYLDPTHIRPLPADLVRFVVESRGFCNARIMPLHPFPECYHLDEKDDRAATVLNELLYGPRDYMIVADRP